MGKAGRWLRSILAGKNRGRREKALPLPHGGEVTPLPQAASTPTTPREKKRWSFRRAPAQGKPAAAAAMPSLLSQEEPSAGEGIVGQSVSGRGVDDGQQSQKAAEVAVATADAAVMADAQAAAAVACLTEAEEEERDLLLATWLVEEAAAARIQATFRGYLARKALCALRGLVKLQALIRGQVVRRQANATLRRMQALVSAQSRLRAQQARLLDHHQDHHHHQVSAIAAQRRSPQHPRRRSSYEMDRSAEEHVKIVEMDAGDAAQRGRSSCSAVGGESRDQRLAAEYYYQYGPGQCSPAPSSFAEFSPRTFSGHLDDLLPFDPARSSTSPYDAGDQGFVPSYMANTESSRAKARSQSAPRQRTHDAALERQPSRRRVPGGAPSRNKTMQRSSSHIMAPSAAAAACGYQYQYQYQYQYPPWASVRLDRSSASLVGSECGSSSSVLTAATIGGYGRSLVGFEVQNRAHY